MNDPQPPPVTTRRGALMTIRIVWAAMLMGQAIFLIVIAVIMQRPAPAGTMSGQPLQLLLYISIAMVAGLVVIGFIVRMSIYNSGRDARGAVAPGKYFTGNI